MRIVDLVDVRNRGVIAILSELADGDDANLLGRYVHQEDKTWRIIGVEWPINPNFRGVMLELKQNGRPEIGDASLGGAR